MSRFCGNTFVEKDEVRSKLREINTYNVEDIKADEYKWLMGEVVTLDDYSNRISDIESEVNQIIKTLKSYDVASALGELEILAEKLW